jgi:hypothetical protein
MGYANPDPILLVRNVPFIRVFTELGVVILLASPRALFGRLLYEAGTESGARETFQMLVTDLVMARYTTANEVAGPGGSDWGIDTYVGKLDDSIVVWQSKFFLDWKRDIHRAPVRDSFNQVVKKAKEKGFEIDAWTLCVPCILPPEEQRWFDTWAAKSKRTSEVKGIELWNGVKLRKFLMQEDVSDVRNSYFPPAAKTTTSVPVAISADVGFLEAALFVRQLQEAGNMETDAARGLFFAAEALARDLSARGDAVGVATLEELHLEIHNIWENKFNSALLCADDAGRIPGLVDQVLQGAAMCSNPEGLQLRPAHRKGAVHRLVENARAGWVRHWREIAEGYSGSFSEEDFAAKLATAQPGDQT